MKGQSCLKMLDIYGEYSARMTVEKQILRAEYHKEKYMEVPDNLSKGEEVNFAIKMKLRKISCSTSSGRV